MQVFSGQFFSVLISLLHPSAMINGYLAATKAAASSLSMLQMVVGVLQLAACARATAANALYKANN